MVYLYPLRKRWRWLGRRGKTRVWLDYHVLLGLTAPLIISFHSSFKLNGFAGMAYWMMVALVISGIIGRYFYAQVPRTLEAAEVTLRELKATSDDFQRQLRDSGLVLLGSAEDFPLAVSRAGGTNVNDRCAGSDGAS